MGIIELFMTAVGLSMDAFAVAICKGLNMRTFRLKQGVLIALSFGFFQALMPVIGWLLGSRFEKYITSVDHWIAFLLLSILGIKMLLDAMPIKKKSSDEIDVTAVDCSNSSGSNTSLNLKELLTLSFATSVDALAVGITFAFLKMDIIPSASLIGITTFIIAFIGVVVGNKFGNRFEKIAGIAGGSILILIGLKILIEHLNLLPV